MSRNLVVCLDGTRNEPETGTTNVVRVFEIATKDDSQTVYYDPGVGTMGARSATTRLGKFLTRVSGLILGHGIKDNIEEAYRFLMQAYQPGDRIFIFGFSRGAYTALALTGMLRTVGLLRAGADNLVPYALKLYTKGGKNKTIAEEAEFWDLRDWFNRTFGNPDFPARFAPQVTYLGIWDAVKTVGWLNWRAKLQQARWPFTRQVPNVLSGRHALAIDEKRRPYAEYRFDPEEMAKPGDRLREMWFVGVHSDVGGTFRDDHRLSDLALQWILEGAIEMGLGIDSEIYEDRVTVEPGQHLSPEHCLGKIHANEFGWALIGFGWRRRAISQGDEIHQSVAHRIEATRDSPEPYSVKVKAAGARP